MSSRPEQCPREIIGYAMKSAALATSTATCGRLRMAPDILNERCAHSKTSAERDR
jgi:hypothetical protein